ncbi:MAG: amidophosphoribosyltransferase, partial [Gemmatimonadota bacterium]
MCGIVGVTGVDAAARTAFLGLYALQHRGQESAGIAALDAEGQARLTRREGLVAESFDDATLDALPGRIALGHTR